MEGVFPLYKKILLAVDGSEHSLRATDEAIKIATIAKESIIEVVLVAEFSKAKEDRKSTRLNSSHVAISYAVFCLKKKKADPRPRKVEERSPLVSVGLPK